MVNFLLQELGLQVQIKEKSNNIIFTKVLVFRILINNAPSRATDSQPAFYINKATFIYTYPDSFSP